jgi:hypothetical protein
MILLLISGPACAQTLEAGVARVDITPPLGLPLQGYGGHPERIAAGVRDPLYARVLVLGAGSTRLALVDLDLIASFGPPYLAQLREATQGDVQNLLVAAIHTHSGPALIPSSTPPPGAWEGSAVAKVAGAVHQAAMHMVAARLGVGYGISYIGHNRLRRNRDGTVTWFEPNWTGASTAPVDPTVAVLRIDDLTGSPLAILVNYACHPVIFHPDNRLYSADFPGVMTRVVEKVFDGKPLCFFLQGGDGDINPNYAVTPLQQGAAELCERTGTELGRVVARVAQQIHTTADANPSLQFAQDAIRFRPRWDAHQWLAADPQASDSIASKTQPEYQLDVTTVLLNKRIAFLAMPGEPFVDFQRDWRARCPTQDCFFLGYANGYYGYFPTISAASWGGYGASQASTWIQVGAGERMLDQALVRVFEMLGRLKPIPEDLKQ